MSSAAATAAAAERSTVDTTSNTKRSRGAKKKKRTPVPSKQAAATVAKLQAPKQLAETKVKQPAAPGWKGRYAVTPEEERAAEAAAEAAAAEKAAEDSLPGRKKRATALEADKSRAALLQHHLLNGKLPSQKSARKPVKLATSKTAAAAAALHKTGNSSAPSSSSASSSADKHRLLELIAAAQLQL
jgi:hypothetical protein